MCDDSLCSALPVRGAISSAESFFVRQGEEFRRRDWGKGLFERVEDPFIPDGIPIPFPPCYFRGTRGDDSSKVKGVDTFLFADGEVVGCLVEEGGEGLCRVADLAPSAGVGGESVGVEEVVDSE